MTPRWDYLIKPLGEEYNNTETVAGKDLIVNTSIEHAKYVNRMGVVVATPPTAEISVGDIVVVHHNVFRTYLNMKGIKTKSREYFMDDKYLVSEEKIYLYNHEGKWRCPKKYCFIKPLDYEQEGLIYRNDIKEKPHVGEIKFIKNYKFKRGETVGFTKNSEYEFNIDGEKLYRMRVSDICSKVELNE